MRLLALPALLHRILLQRRRGRMHWWLLASLVCGAFLVGHGCHGDADHELSLNLEQASRPEPAQP
jgi:hypothetical protein